MEGEEYWTEFIAILCGKYRDLA